MDDRAFWQEVRRGLMLIVKAIEKRYPPQQERKAG